MHASRRIVTSLVLATSLLAAGIAAPAASASPSGAAKPAAASETKPVDINTADAAGLESIPGIGKALAQRIITFREKNGAYQTVDDLLKIQGIGEKSLEKLRPYVTVGRTK